MCETVEAQDGSTSWMHRPMSRSSSGVNLGEAAVAFVPAPASEDALGNLIGVKERSLISVMVVLTAAVERCAAADRTATAQKRGESPFSAETLPICVLHVAGSPAGCGYSVTTPLGLSPQALNRTNPAAALQCFLSHPIVTPDHIIFGEGQARDGED